MLLLIFVIRNTILKNFYNIAQMTLPKKLHKINKKNEEKCSIWYIKLFLMKKKVPVHIILKKQSTLLKKFLAWTIILNFFTFLFENLTMQLQSYENSPSHIQCKECLWCIKNTSSLSLLAVCNWFFTKNRLPIIIINWMEITLIIKAEKER